MTLNNANADGGGNCSNCQLPHDKSRQKAEKRKGVCERERERLLQIVAYFFGLGSYEVPPVL